MARKYRVTAYSINSLTFYLSYDDSEDRGTVLDPTGCLRPIFVNLLLASDLYKLYIRSQEGGKKKGKARKPPPKQKGKGGRKKKKVESSSEDDELAGEHYGQLLNGDGNPRDGRKRSKFR
jgi:hypothetical protein